MQYHKAVSYLMLHILRQPDLVLSETLFTNLSCQETTHTGMLRNFKVCNRNRAIPCAAPQSHHRARGVGAADASQDVVQHRLGQGCERSRGPRTLARSFLPDAWTWAELYLVMRHSYARRARLCAGEEVLGLDEAA